MNKQLFYQLIIPFTPIVISFIAIIYAIKSYHQSNKINNENILYQEKIHGYKEIVYALSDLLNKVQMNFFFVKDLVSKSNLTDEELIKIYDYADEVDDKTDEFDNIVKANAIILPQKILDPLEDLIADLYQTQSLEKLDKKDFEKFDQTIEVFLLQAEKLVKLIRKDLKSNALNETLFKRINTFRTTDKRKR